MTNDIQSSNTGKDLKQPIPFGMRLKTAREGMGIEYKEAAAQLRLNEKIIQMLEKERFPADLPVTFIRGYMRSYGKLLQIPDLEIKKAVEMIKHKPTPHHSLPTFHQVPVNTMTSGNYFMQFFTYLILFTLLGLVSMWWYTHNAATVQVNDNGMQGGLNDASLNTHQAPLVLPTANVALPNTSPDNHLTSAKVDAETIKPQVEPDAQKLTNNSNLGIMPGAPAANNESVSEEDELQASADAIEENNNED